ncbi:MAG: hypothetical protein DHS20C17_18280 [Cyclobacteriaceae bacterium]|nr:MAG: hypothetical protein DHS20C17_18280 [Cyclobacteriaceae bacterium]
MQVHSQAPANGSETLLPDSLALYYARSITVSDLKNYLSILASDALEGRDTGSRGQKMAAAFIREHFKDNSLLPIIQKDSDSLYFQKMKLYRNYLDDVFIATASKKYRNQQELVYLGNANITSTQEFKIQFVGDGEENDYRDMTVDGAMVAFFAKSPNERQRKVKISRDHGAEACFVINADDQEEFSAYVQRNSKYFEAVTITREQVKSGSTITFLSSYQTLSELLAVERQKLDQAVKKAGRSSRNPYRKLSTTINVKAEMVSEKFETENVLGLVEGSDKKDELLVITSHYDHIGRNGDNIYNGADDNGSGTSAVMELAQAFASAKKKGHGPRRSILFMTVTGEEKGLLGSEFYSNHPAWPLEKTVANLNVDMIGRVDPHHESTGPYVYVIGSNRLSLDLHQINEQVNELYTGLELDYKYNAADDPNRFYYRSDHYNFARHNIPIIFYFNGTHADYHQPTDTIEKIRFDLLKTRTDLIFYCAWELANREERIRLNK